MPFSRFLLSLTTALLLTLSFGCEQQDQSARTDANASATGGDGINTGPSTSTRTFIDALGRTITMPAEPQRIVALSETDLDAMLALGVKPGGAINGRGQNVFPRYLDASLTQGIESVGSIGSPSFEAVLIQSPDLILLGGYYPESMLQKLERIAPVAVTYRMQDDWKVAFENVAQLLGKQAEHEAFMARYDARLAEVREAIGDHVEDTVSIIRWNPKGPIFMYTTVFASRVISDIGLNRPPHQIDGGDAPHSPILSLESLDQLDADWIFMGTLTPEGEANAAMQAATSTPAFQALDAVRNDQLVAVDGSVWTSIGGPLAAMQVLDDVQSAMAN